MKDTAENFEGVEFQNVRLGEGRPLEIIKLKELTEGQTVVTGTYVRTTANKFKPAKPSFIIQTADADVLINDSGNLGVQMAKAGVGALVRIIYNGKSPMKSGQYKGTLAHNFSVLTAKSAAADDEGSDD